MQDIKTVLLVVDMQRGAAEGRYHGQYLNRRWWERYSIMMQNILRLSERVSETVFVTDTRFRKVEHLDIVQPLHSLSETSAQFFKRMDDGSAAVGNFLDTDSRILVVGMNTNACVLRTARGLLKRDFNVAVVGDACWTAYASKSAQPHHDGLRSVRRSGIPVFKTQDICAFDQAACCSVRFSDETIQPPPIMRSPL